MIKFFLSTLTLICMITGLFSINDGNTPNNQSLEQEEFIEYFHRSTHQLAEEMQRNDRNEFWFKNLVKQLRLETSESVSQTSGRLPQLKNIQLSALDELKKAEQNASLCFEEKTNCHTLQNHIHNLTYLSRLMKETYDH